LEPNPKPAKPTTWTVRYAERILKDDLDDVGHAAFQMARKAIDKKLKVAPDQYGESLHDPLHLFRKLKASHIRIVYRVNPDAAEVLILMIGDRRDIWDTEQTEILDRYEEERDRPIVRTKTQAKKQGRRRRGQSG
jgi:mRNA interferase RelE/StbE